MMKTRNALLAALLAALMILALSAACCLAEHALEG